MLAAVLLVGSVDIEAVFDFRLNKLGRQTPTQITFTFCKLVSIMCVV